MSHYNENYDSLKKIFDTTSPQKAIFWYKVAEVVGRENLNPYSTVWYINQLENVKPPNAGDLWAQIQPKGSNRPLNDPDLLEYFLEDVKLYETALYVEKGWFDLCKAEGLWMRCYRETKDQSWSFWDSWRRRRDLITLHEHRPNFYPEDSLWTVTEKI